MGELFGTFIRSRRQALNHERGGYSIRKLAGRIRVHHSFLSKIERGEPACLSERKLVALALELGEDPDLVLAMNGKVAEDVRRAILKRPALFSRLIRELRNAPDEEVVSHQALRQARSQLAQRLRDKGRLLRQALEARRATERELTLFRRAIHNGPTATVLVDGQGHLTYANPAFLRLWGYADEKKVQGLHRDALWAEPSKDLYYFESVLADGRPKTVERRARRADGRTFLARVQVMPYTNLQGKVLGALGFLEDVTRERALVQGLIRGNHWLRQFVENMNDVLFTMGADGLFTYVSPSAGRLRGTKPEEMMGRHYARAIHPADRELVDSHVRQALQGRFTVFECRLQRPNGCQAWARVSLGPRWGAGGRVMGLQGVSTDISARKSVEAMLDDLLQDMRHPLDTALSLLEHIQADPNPEAQRGRMMVLHDELLQLHGLAERLERHWSSGGAFEAAPDIISDRTRNGSPPDARSGSRRGAEHPARPRILLVEDPVHEIQAAGALLDRLGFPHTRTRDPGAARLLLARQTYVLVFLDLDLPGLDCPTLVRALRGEHGGFSRRAVLLGLAWPGRHRERDCLVAGLDGILHKPLTAERLIEVLELIPGLGGHRAPLPSGTRS